MGIPLLAYTCFGLIHHGLGYGRNSHCMHHYYTNLNHKQLFAVLAMS